MFGAIKLPYLQKKREDLFLAHRWEELVPVCRDIVELAPADFPAVHDLLVALKECKRLDEAYQYCETALRLGPKGPPEQVLTMNGQRYMRHLIVIAEVFVHREEFDRARVILTALKKTGTAFHKKHLLLSEIAERTGNLAQAAAELEEMNELYASREVNQWEHVILSRCRALLAVANERRDAAAMFMLTRLTVRCRERIGELDSYVDGRTADPKMAQDWACLRGQRALLRRRWQDVEGLTAYLAANWPQLAALFAAAAAVEGAQADAAAERLKALPVGSRVRLELLIRARPMLRGNPAYLRALSESMAAAGRLEEAFQAHQELTSRTACDLNDLARAKDLRQLLLERAIWEDEARLGLRKEVPLETSGLPDLQSIGSIALNGPGGTLLVEPSLGFRLAAGHAAATSEQEVRVRLAESYLRRDARADAAVRLLEQTAQSGSPLAGKALCLLALQRVRLRDGQAAAAIARFQAAAKAMAPEDRKRMTLDIGDAAEAAGSAELAAGCYNALLSEDPDFADIRERLERLRTRPPAAPVDADTPPTLRDRFQDLKPIGRGGMGLVFKAFDPLFGRAVAIKVLSDSFRGDAAAVARFIREGQAMALLQHPNIVRIYEVGTGRDVYLAMEFLEGQSLRALLKQSSRLPAARVAELAAVLCEALGFAHAAGIIHRDIKPDNVQLTQAGQLKLLDFGLADIAAATALTREGTMLGTGQYMAPEQIRGADMDARADIYAVGAMLYELLTGRPPFYQGDLAYQHLNEPPKPLRQAGVDVPPGLEAAVMKCLEKDPARRFQNCKELAAAIKEAVPCRT